MKKYKTRKIKIHHSDNIDRNIYINNFSLMFLDYPKSKDLVDWVEFKQLSWDFNDNKTSIIDLSFQIRETPEFETYTFFNALMLFKQSTKVDLNIFNAYGEFVKSIPLTVNRVNHIDTSFIKTSGIQNCPLSYKIKLEECEYGYNLE